MTAGSGPEEVGGGRARLPLCPLVAPSWAHFASWAQLLSKFRTQRRPNREVRPLLAFFLAKGALTGSAHHSLRCKKCPCKGGHATQYAAQPSPRPTGPPAHTPRADRGGVGLPGARRPSPASPAPEPGEPGRPSPASPASPANPTPDARAANGERRTANGERRAASYADSQTPRGPRHGPRQGPLAIQMTSGWVPPPPPRLSAPGRPSPRDRHPGPQARRPRARFRRHRAVPVAVVLGQGVVGPVGGPDDDAADRPLDGMGVGALEGLAGLVGDAGTRPPVRSGRCTAGSRSAARRRRGSRWPAGRPRRQWSGPTKKTMAATPTPVRNGLSRGRSSRLWGP